MYDIYLFVLRHKNRLPFLHESGFAVFYGLVVGAILRFVGPSRPITSLRVRPVDIADGVDSSTLKPGDVEQLRIPDRLLISFNNTSSGGIWTRTSRIEQFLWTIRVNAKSSSPTCSYWPWYKVELFCFLEKNSINVLAFLRDPYRHLLVIALHWH